MELDSTLRTAVKTSFIGNMIKPLASAMKTTAIIEDSRGVRIGGWKECGRGASSGGEKTGCILENDCIRADGLITCGPGACMAFPIKENDMLFGSIIACPSGEGCGGDGAPPAEVKAAFKAMATVLGKLCYQGIVLDSATEELLSKYEELNVLYEMSEDMSNIIDMESFYRKLVDKTAEILNATIVSVMLLDEETETLHIKHAKGLAPEIIKGTSVMLGEEISGYVAQTGRPLSVEDISCEPGFLKLKKEKYATNSFISVPIQTKERTIGVLNAADRENGDVFKMGDQKLLISLASQAAIAIERAQLVETVIEKEAERIKLKSTFERYVSPQVVDLVVQQSEDGCLQNELREVTVLFSDIRGFTSISERLSPEEIVKMLNSYFNAMTKVIFKYEGTVDKFIGDAVMAVFGAPILHDSRYGPSEAQRAVYTAIEMRDVFGMLARRWSSENPIFDGIHIGIGVNTGVVVAGNIGSVMSMQYAVIGDTVNTASRITSAAKGGQVLASERTFREIRNLVEARELPPITVKGKKDPLVVYEILGVDY